MSADDAYLEAADKMEKAVGALEHQLRTIRTGRASASLVDHVRVDYYGAQTPLGQIANIATPDPQLIVIRAFDPSALKAIEKAILQSELGVTPNNDGKLIRLAIPPLSEERRRQLASQVKQMGEQAKVAIRNVRRDAKREIEKLEEDGKISEDQSFKAVEELQDLTKESESKTDQIVSRKSEEIMKF
jgi:ribosome recycling factor